MEPQGISKTICKDIDSFIDKFSSDKKKPSDRISKEIKFCEKIAGEIQKKSDAIFSSDYFEARSISNSLDKLSNFLRAHNSSNDERLSDLVEVFDKMSLIIKYKKNSPEQEAVNLIFSETLSSYGGVIGGDKKQIEVMRAVLSENAFYENMLPSWVKRNSMDNLYTLRNLGLKKEEIDVVFSELNFINFDGKLPNLKKMKRYGQIDENQLEVRLTNFDKKISGDYQDLSKKDCQNLVEFFPWTNSLRITSSVINKKDLELLGHFPALKKVRFENLKTSSFEGFLETLNGKSLESLELSLCTLKEDELALIGNFKSLKSLNLDGTELVNLQELEKLSTLVNLESLDLSGQAIGDEEIELIVKQFPKLKKLILYNANITDAGVQKLSALASLESLSLASSNEVTDEALKFIASFSKLKSVDLSECLTITDKGLKELEALKDLKKLVLTFSLVSQSGVEHFEKNRPDTVVVSNYNLHLSEG